MIFRNFLPNVLLVAATYFLVFLVKVTAGEGGGGRRTFDGSLTLAEAVLMALEANPDLQIRASQLAESEAGISGALAEFDPTLTIRGTYNDRRDPTSGSDLDGADQPERENAGFDVSVEKKFTTGTTVELNSDVLDRSETNSSFSTINPVYDNSIGLRISQPLLKNAGRERNLATLRLERLAFDRSDLGQRTELNNVLLETEEAYWTLAASVSAEEVRRAGLELASVIQRETKERRKVNLTTGVDVLEAEASTSESREALIIAASATRDAADRLFRVIGILGDIEPGNLQLEPLPTKNDANPEAETSYSRALANAPEMLVLGNLIRAREIDFASSKNDRLPELNLNFSTGILGRGGSFGAGYDRLIDRDGLFWEATVEMRVPWGFRLEKAEVEQAKQVLKQAHLEKRKAELQLYADVRGACRTVELAGQRITTASATARLNRARFNQAKEERSAGNSTLLDLLQAREDMEEAELRIIEARVDLLRSVATLAQLEGTLPERHGIGQERPARAEGEQL